MKISKILMGAAALTGALILGGCRQNEDEHGILNIKGDTASIDYTNEDTITYRGFNTLRTKHTDAVAVVSIDTNKAKAEDGDKAGVFGFLFDLQKNSDKKNTAGESKQSYDFSTVAIRYYDGELGAYVSRYTGVSPEYMDGGNNFNDVDNKEIGTKGSVGTEVSYLKGTPFTKSNAYARLESVTPIDGIVKVAIKVTADTENGKYTVTFYDGNTAIQEKSETAEDGTTVKTGDIASDATKLSFTGTGKTGLSSNTVTLPSVGWKAGASSAKAQTEMGFYAAVYPKATLVGEIKLPYILNEGEVAEWYE